MARTKDFDEQDVLTKAEHLFWLKGYNATSMQDLVDGLGISRSSLYDTFGDKHSLFIRSLENYRAGMTAKLQATVNNANTARDAVRGLLDLTTRELLSDNEHKGCFLVNSAVEVGPHDAEVNKIICNGDRELEEFFCTAIKRGQDSGEISTAKDARALAGFIINSIKGVRVTAKSITDRKLFKDIIDMTMSVLD
ncbi:MAG TPA: TetR/AcrR family transcriptional regulator [Mucilaginibacter sp.]|jgi:TetR/AcrR family transcriptional repressor of nem operon|nr:TetR/AcrR family transcriptional regulator [Mucilaginibacter sp.]